MPKLKFALHNRPVSNRSATPRAEAWHHMVHAMMHTARTSTSPNGTYGMKQAVQVDQASTETEQTSTEVEQISTKVNSGV